MIVYRKVTIFRDLFAQRYEAKLGGCVLLTSSDIRSQRPRDTSSLVGHGCVVSNRLSNCKPHRGFHDGKSY